MKKPLKINQLLPDVFQHLILKWFDRYGRKNLPWQLNKTPYRVWVSEIMLQQTQVSTVITYFQRFMARFPDIERLAEAETDEVLHLWTGLGYYARARNLHQTARKIVAVFGGQFPDTLAALETLPGIGRSTAGAILALAFEKSATILDGNVKRVLTRFQGLTEWPGEKKTLEQLWTLAEHYTPNLRIADYTQAMMDIGATLCVRGQPECQRCPLNQSCIAHHLGIEKTLPKAKPTKVLPTREVTLILFQKKNSILLKKRPSTGIWGGLWSFPEISGLATLQEIKKVYQPYFQEEIAEVTFGKQFRHTFSHFHLMILPVLIPLKTRKAPLLESETEMWYNLQAAPAIGLPQPIKFLLETLPRDTSDSLRQTAKRSRRTPSTTLSR